MGRAARNKPCNAKYFVAEKPRKRHLKFEYVRAKTIIYTCIAVFSCIAAVKAVNNYELLSLGSVDTLE